jgi:hypothetical protein
MKSTEKTLAEIFNDTNEVTQRARQAVRDALREHKRAGNPVAIWRDGKVVILPPEEIPDDAESANGEEASVTPPTPEAR